MQRYEPEGKQAVLRIFLLALPLVVLAGPAVAQQYQVTFVGGILKAGNGDPRVPGATHVVAVWLLDSKPAAGQCVQYNTVPESYTDGANTLATLQAAGYSVKGGLMICMDAADKKIVGWEVGVSGVYYPTPTTEGVYNSDNRYNLPSGPNQNFVLDFLFKTGPYYYSTAAKQGKIKLVVVK